MIKAYLNQNLSWKHAGTLNEYNEPTYTTTTIKGRKETGHKLVRNKQGQEVVSSAWVVTQSAIAPNDKIDGSLVISVEEAVQMDGTTKFYEGYLV